MKRFFMMAALVLLPPALAASPVPANCTAGFSVGIRSVYYTSKASFPDEPQRIRLDFQEFPQGVSLCGLKFSHAERRLKITGDSSLDALSRLFPDPSKGGKRLAIENYYAPLEAWGPGPTSYLLSDPKTYRLSYTPPGRDSAAFALGATVNGGPVQRLYYQGKVSTVNVPRTARTVDVYVKVDPEILSGWQRVTLDLKGLSITLYDEAVFPAK